MNYVQALDAPERNIGQIKLHEPAAAFAGMAAAGRLAAACLDMLVPETKEGVTTKRLDDLARQFVFDHGALPACVFYRGYRHTVCTSRGLRKYSLARARAMLCGATIQTSALFSTHDRGSNRLGSTTVL